MSLHSVNTIEHVQEGDALPTLAVRISARTVIMGATSSRDWQPQHHDHLWAVERAGTKDIFLNTPNQAGWIERYLTDWTGPLGRLGRLRFRMRRSVFPGDTLVFGGTVKAVTDDDEGCRWIDVELQLSVDGEVATECTARIATRRTPDENPWRIDAEHWRP
ncbi:MAG: hotdog family protein [Actinomycetota bacterium]